MHRWDTPDAKEALKSHAEELLKSKLVVIPDEVLASQDTHPGTQAGPISQRINGAGHQVVANNSTVRIGTSGKNPAIQPTNPHAIRCPQCTHNTGRYSEACTTCGYAVRKHYEEVKPAKRRGALDFLFKVTIAGIVSLFGASLPNISMGTRLALGAAFLFTCALAYFGHQEYQRIKAKWHEPE